MSDYPRAAQFGHDTRPEVSAAVLRGVHADALEKSFTRGELGRVLRGLLGDDDALVTYHAICVALFPELYAVPKAEGIVPPSGGRRVGRERLSAAAAQAKLAQAVLGRSGDGRP